LLAEREDFDSDISSALEEDAGGGDQGEEEWQHSSLVLTWPNGTDAAPVPVAASY
jgi:hypothetical protein